MNTRALVLGLSLARCGPSTDAPASVPPTSEQPELVEPGDLDERELGLPEADPSADLDGDGVVARDDACPHHAEDRDGEQDDDGCPELSAHVERCHIIPGAKIEFEIDDDHLTTASRPLLDEIVVLLELAPEIELEIAAHVVPSGEAHGRKLSKQRAESVRRYLIDRGVAATRLIAVGYEATRPLDTNETPEGRNKNRRVEFVRLDVPGCR